MSAYAGSDPTNNFDPGGRYATAPCSDDPHDPCWDDGGGLCDATALEDSPNPPCFLPAVILLAADDQGPTCGDANPIYSQPEAQQIAVLFGEDSWNFAPQRYSYASVAREDLFMLQVMYNQASASTKTDVIADYVSSTINAGTYNGYPRGRGLLISTFSEPLDSNDCRHLISAEATYSTFWGGSHDFSTFNKWAQAGSGIAPAGATQIASTQFWYATQTSVSPQPPKRHPIIPIPRKPGPPVGRAI